MLGIEPDPSFLVGSGHARLPRTREAGTQGHEDPRTHSFEGLCCTVAVKNTTIQAISARQCYEPNSRLCLVRGRFAH